MKSDSLCHCVPPPFATKKIMIIWLHARSTGGWGRQRCAYDGLSRSCSTRNMVVNPNFQPTSTYGEGIFFSEQMRSGIFNFLPTQSASLRKPVQQRDFCRSVLPPSIRMDSVLFRHPEGSHTSVCVAANAGRPSKFAHGKKN